VRVVAEKTINIPKKKSVTRTAPSERGEGGKDGGSPQVVLEKEREQGGKNNDSRVNNEGGRTPVFPHEVQAYQERLDKRRTSGKLDDMEKKGPCAKRKRKRRLPGRM